MEPIDQYDLPPFRPGSSPQLDVRAAKLRAERLHQPAWIRLTPVILKVLRYHFSMVTNIEFPPLTNRVYQGLPTDPIVIASLAEWRPDSSGQRPAILVDRLDQDLNTEQRGIGNQMMGIRPNSFAHFMMGNHVIHCLGGAEGEAEILACEVWRELMRFSSVIRKAACLQRFLPMKIGKRVKLTEEQKQHYTVPVIVSYGYEEDYRVSPLDEAGINAITTILQTE